MTISRTSALLFGSALLQGSSAFAPQLGGSARGATSLFERKPFMYVAPTLSWTVRKSEMVLSHNKLSCILIPQHGKLEV